MHSAAEPRCERYDIPHIDVLRFLGKIFSMRIKGNLFHAARALAGLTRDDLATRARLSRDVLYSWETSSDAPRNTKCCAAPRC
jgi:DNA-binding XRE family transcriptional regulator